jgi:cysteinyl-tRNA synthetase
VKYWMHTGLLNVKGEKMSKSLRNFWSLPEALAEYDGEVLRFFLVHAQYRSPIDFSMEAIAEAEAAYRRIVETVANLAAELRRAPATGPHDHELGDASAHARRAFEAAMDDDFNTREALAAVFDFTNAVNRALGAAGRAALADASATFESFGDVLGLWRRSSTQGKALTDAVIEAFVELREEARMRKDFALSDRIRDLLAARGIVLEDTKTGVRWKAR